MAKSGKGTDASPATSIEKAKSTALTTERQEWYDPSAPSEPEERMIQFVKLVQHSSAEAKERTAEIGDMVTSTGINLGKHAVIIPLWRQRQAAKFNRDDNSLECKSFDGITGDRYGACSACQFDYRKWTTGPKGERVKPECAQQAAFPAVIVSSENFEDGSEIGIAAFQFSSTSFGVAKQIITQHDLKGLPYYAYRWEIGSRTKSFKKGSAQVYTARFDGSVEQETMLQAQSVCQSWAGAKVDIDDRSTMGDDDFDGGGTAPVDDGPDPF